MWIIQSFIQVQAEVTFCESRSKTKTKIVTDRNKNNQSLTGISSDCSPRSHGGLRAFGRVANQYVVMAANAPIPMMAFVGKPRTYCRKSSSSGIRSCLRMSWACMAVLHWACLKAHKGKHCLETWVIGWLWFPSSFSCWTDGLRFDCRTLWLQSLWSTQVEVCSTSPHHQPSTTMLHRWSRSSSVARSTFHLQLLSLA